MNRYIRILISAFGILLTQTAEAQLCNGSLGDPVVNLTFGSGGNGGGPSSFVPTSSYLYTSSTCPDDGYYTITNFSTACFGNTWFTINDHTGGGNYMLVNASYNPGDFFLATVSDLCPNTTYEFAAWVMNVMKPFNSIRPNLTFNIEKPDGTILGTYQTGDLPVTTAAEWKQFGLYFTTPPGNATIVLRITNSAPGGYGNDIALDDITFRPCGSLITANIIGITSDTVDICTGDPAIFDFTATAPGYTSPAYRWQVSLDSGATWQDIAGASSLVYQRLPTSVGRYCYRMTVTESADANIAACRIASTAIVINVHPYPVVDAGPDRVILSGGDAVLNSNAAGENISYTWSPNINISNVSDLNPVVSPLADTWYKLSVVSAYGCKSDDDVFVRVVSGIFVPTAFTPNGDGKNDKWEIPFLDPSFEGNVSVFNRWGQLVYHSESVKVSWDGTYKGIQQPPGSYIYMVFVKKYNLLLKGTVTLIR